MLYYAIFIFFSLLINLTFACDKQMRSAVLVILHFAPDVNRSFSRDGIIRAKYGGCQHIWIFCYVGCHGPWRVHTFERYPIYILLTNVNIIICA